MSDSPREPRFEGNVAIVTGAASGIGAAISRRLLNSGARVVACDLAFERDGGEVTAFDGDRLLQIGFDVTRPEAHFEAVDLALARFGLLDMAFNCAGIPGTPAPAARQSVATWKEVMGVNLDGVFYGIRAQVPAMLACGRGAIVNVASTLGQVATAGLAPYVAAKHGLVGLTKAVAIDYGSLGIRCNAVGPGYIDTPMLRKRDQEELRSLKALHVLDRLGTAEEVAAVACFLASNDASFITGAYYPVDGGYICR